MNPAPSTTTPAPKPERRTAIAVSRAVLERVILVAVLSGSFWAIWYSTGRLRSLHTHSRQLNQQISRLTAEIDLMKAQWSGSRTQEIASRYEKVGDALFLGESSITAWNEALQRDSVPLALETQFRLTGTQTATNGSRTVTRVRGVIEVQPSPSTRSPRPLYHRLVDWSRQLATQPRRIDLLELRVNSSGRSLATVELWTQDRDPSEPAAPPASTPVPVTPASPVETPEPATDTASAAHPDPVSVASAATSTSAATSNPSQP